MNRIGVWITLGVVVLLAALIGWWFYTFERVPKEVDLPMRGEASYNPLFALKKTLQAQHIDAITHAGLNLPAMALKSGDTLLLNADVRALSESQVDSILDWVEQGGHLIFVVPHAAEGRAGELLSALDMKVKAHFSCLSLGQIETNTDAADKTPATTSDAQPEPDPELDSELDSADESRAKSAKKTDKNLYCSSFRFTVGAKQVAEFSWLWGSAKNGYVFGRHDLGDGDWFAAASLDFLTNRKLNESDNATLAWQVLAPVLGKGKVHLVYAADVAPWYVLIVRYGWPILLSLLLALLAWLWARSQRFGPLSLPAPAHRRALLEHVQAAGDFAYRRGRSPALYEVARRAFLERLRRRDPALASLRGTALQQALETQYGFSASDLQQALSPADLHRPLQFFVTIKTLMSLRSKL